MRETDEERYVYIIFIKTYRNYVAKNSCHLHNYIWSPSMVTTRTFQRAPWNGEAGPNIHQLKESSTSTVTVHNLLQVCKNYTIKWSKIILLSGDKWWRWHVRSILLWHRGLQTIGGSFSVTASLFTDTTSVSKKTAVNLRLGTLPHTSTSLARPYRELLITQPHRRLALIQAELN